VRLGEPVPIAEIGDRKKLAARAFESVRSDFSQLLTGRSVKPQVALKSSASAKEGV
jgi:hypothetical protein